MTWFLLLGGVALAVLVALCCTALVEVFRQLEELRRSLNLEDLPIPLALKRRDLHAKDVGLPAQLAEAPAAVVIILSARCTTCLAIAEALRDGTSTSVWFVLPTPPHPDHLLRTLSQSADRVILDEDEAIVGALDLRITPAVLTLSFGEIKRAHVVSSPRQLASLVPTIYHANGGPPSTSAQASAVVRPEALKGGGAT